MNSKNTETTFNFDDLDVDVDDILDEIDVKEQQIEAKNMVSLRCKKVRDYYPYYFHHFMTETPPKWSLNNRNGFINLAVSENLLCADLLAPRLKEAQSQIQITNETLFYTFCRYFEPLQKRMSEFIAEHIVSTKCKLKINYKNMVFSAGLTNLLPMLVMTLCNEGDIIIVPSPFFSGWHIDLQILETNALIVPIPTSMKNGFDIDEDELNALYKKYCHRIKMCLFTSPNNPSGKVYNAKQVKLVYEWCANHKVHFVADEVYALSPVSETASPFVSAFEFFDTMKDKKYFHWLYGMSKDFCLSGVRLGVYYTENEAVRKGLLQYHLQFAVPWHTQQLVYQFLSDKEWINGFLKQNKQRLIQMYNVCKIEMKKYEIDYYEAEHGLFVWINLSEWLKTMNKGDCNDDNLWKMEKEFGDALRLQKNVFMAPGECFGATEPGFYRICFGAVPNEEALKDAFKKINQMKVLFQQQQIEAVK